MLDLLSESKEFPARYFNETRGEIMKGLVVGFLAISAIGSSAVAQATLLSDLSELETGFWNAHVLDDRSYFAANLAADAVDISGDGVTVGKEPIIDRIFSCEGIAFELDNWALHRIRADVVVLTFKAEYALSCDGESIQKNVVVSSTYARRDRRWLNVAYQESDAVDD